MAKLNKKEFKISVQRVVCENYDFLFPDLNEVIGIEDAIERSLKHLGKVKAREIVFHACRADFFDEDELRDALTKNVNKTLKLFDQAIAMGRESVLEKEAEVWKDLNPTSSKEHKAEAWLYRAAKHYLLGDQWYLTIQALCFAEREGDEAAAEQEMKLIVEDLMGKAKKITKDKKGKS